MKVVGQFIRHVTPSIIRPMRVLWNQVIGFVFLSLAVLALPGAVRYWREYETSGEALPRLIVTGLFMLIMGSFGISSFLRARKIGRS